MTDPPELCCPLSKALMLDPVVAADGITYERAWVEECFERNPLKSPMTLKPVETMVPWQEHLKATALCLVKLYTREL